MMEISNITELFARLSIGVIALCIMIYSICGSLNTTNNISNFKGDIVETKHFRYYKCSKCGRKINIHKEKNCKKCGYNLF